MRILFLSNLYPPHSQGGYEQLCQEMAQAFAARGHAVTVLTSRVAGKKSAGADGPVRVYRHLELELEGGIRHTAARLAFGRKASENRNIVAVENIIADFVPDAALVWGMWNVPRSVPATLERLMADRVAYYFCDYWATLPNAYIQRFQEPARRNATSMPKRLLAAWFLPRLLAEPPVELAFNHSACVSDAVRELLVARLSAITDAPVIHLGIRVAEFASPSPARSENGCLRLVYAGRLAPEKGVHTAIGAIGHLNKNKQVSLDIYGTGAEAYKAQLEMLANNLPVTFRGTVARPDLLIALKNYDAFVFPSEWEEPFAHAVLEAMAAGLVVVGTTTGGTGEVLREGETGLTFAAGDAAGLARQIERLAADPELRARLATAGQEVVARDFNIDHTVDQLEALLIRIARQEEVAVA